MLNTAGEVRYLEICVLLCMGQGISERLLIFERQGMGRMGLRGRIGHRLVQKKKLMVVVRETGQVMGVQRMGLEPRRGLGDTRADPPPAEPAESHTGDGGEWGGAARGRGDRPPPASAAGSDRAYRFFPARHTSLFASGRMP